MSWWPPAVKAPAARDDDGHLWPRVILVVSLFGGAFMYLVSNYARALPVLSSWPVQLAALIGAYALGHLSNYWMVAMPLLKRVEAAETRLTQAEIREHELKEQIANLRESVARHETALMLIERPGARKTRARKARRAPKAETPPEA